MDSFGYTIFLVVPILALVLGGIAWAIQTRANRRIDALLFPDRTASSPRRSLFSIGPVNISDDVVRGYSGIAQSAADEKSARSGVEG
jgi:hypothetical protein